MLKKKQTKNKYRSPPYTVRSVFAHRVTKHVRPCLVGCGTEVPGHRSQRKDVLTSTGGHWSLHALQRHVPHRARHLGSDLSQRWSKKGGRHGEKLKENFAERKCKPPSNHGHRSSVYFTYYRAGSSKAQAKQYGTSLSIRLYWSLSLGLQ